MFLRKNVIFLVLDESGMLNLKDSGIALLKKGIISCEELERVVTE